MSIAILRLCGCHVHVAIIVYVYAEPVSVKRHRCRSNMLYARVVVLCQAVAHRVIGVADRAVAQHRVADMFFDQAVRRIVLVVDAAANWLFLDMRALPFGIEGVRIGRQQIIRHRTRLNRDQTVERVVSIFGDRAVRVHHSGLVAVLVIRVARLCAICVNHARQASIRVIA